VNLFHVNADQTPRYSRHSPELLNETVNIGFWKLGVGGLPRPFRGGLPPRQRGLDTQCLRAGCHPTEVARAGFCGCRSPWMSNRRARLPETMWERRKGSSCSCFAFDMASVFERKEPAGRVRAFRRLAVRSAKPLILKVADAAAYPAPCGLLREACFRVWPLQFSKANCLESE